MDRPSTMVSMVAEGAEIAAFRLWMCSSTLVPLERGLEGKLTDLRWQAMLGMEAMSLFSLEMEEKSSFCYGVFPALASLFI